MNTPVASQPMTADLVARLAQEIRRVDGSHSLGAGALAEALAPFVEREAASALRSSGEAVAAGWVFQHDETGRMTFCPNDGVNTPEVFAELNPRYALCGAAHLHSATPANAWRPIAEAPADFRDGTFIVTNRLGEVAPMVRGVIQNNVGSRDWTFGEPITEWQPLPPTSTKA